MIKACGDQTQKTCTQCRIEKPLTEFHKNARHKFGRHSWCKDCKRKYNEAHTDIYKNSSRKSYLKNRDQVIEDSRIRSNNNPKHYRELRRRSRNNSIAALTDSYMREYAKRMGFLNPEPIQIEIMRQRIIAKRTLKEIKIWREANESNSSVVHG